MAVIDSEQLWYTPYEPKLKNRFIMELGDTGIPAYTIKTAQRPQITFDEVVLEHMNITKYVKGKGRWQTLQITLYDPIVPSAASEGLVAPIIFLFSEIAFSPSKIITSIWPEERYEHRAS